MTEQSPSPSDVGSMYDQFSDLFTASLGDNIHLGFWPGDQDTAPLSEAADRLTDLVADRLTAAPGTEVLDVGCGNGLPTLRIAARRRVHVEGVTVSARQLRTALARPESGPGVGRAAFQLADAMALPFADGRFAGAYAIESIVHMSDRAKAVAEIARVLSPGATLVTSDFYLDGDLTPREAEILDAARRPFLLPRFPRADEYPRHMAAAGFDLIEFDDVTANIRRSHRLIADTLRQAVRRFDLTAELRTQVEASAELTERIGTLTQLRYALITARRM